MIRALLAMLILSMAGCGPAADVWLRVEAPFVVPSQCDALEVKVQRTSDGTQLFDQVFNLDGSQQFPLTLSLSTRDSKNLGGALSIEVTARESQQLVSQGQTTVTLADGQVASPVVQLTSP